MGCGSSTGAAPTQVSLGGGKIGRYSSRGGDQTITCIHSPDDDAHRCKAFTPHCASSFVTNYKMSHESCNAKKDEKETPLLLFPGRRGSLLGEGLHRKVAVPFGEEQHLNRRRSSMSTDGGTTKKQRKRPVVFRSVLTEEERENAERRGQTNDGNDTAAVADPYYQLHRNQYYLASEEHLATTSDTLNDLMGFNSGDRGMGIGITFEDAAITEDKTNNTALGTTPVVATLRPVGGGFVPLGSSVAGTPLGSYRKPQHYNNCINNVPVLKVGAIVVSPPLTMNSARSSLVSSILPDELGSPLSMSHQNQRPHQRHRSPSSHSLFSGRSPQQAQSAVANPNYVFTSTTSSSLGGGSGGNHQHTHASIACAPTSELFSYAMISTVNYTSSENTSTSSQFGGGMEDNDGGGGVCQKSLPIPIQYHNNNRRQRDHQHLCDSLDGDNEDHDDKSDVGVARGGVLQQFTVSFTNDEYQLDDVLEFRPLIFVIDDQKQQQHKYRSGGSNNDDDENESPSPDLSVVTKADINVMGRLCSSKPEDEKSVSCGDHKSVPSTFHPPTTRCSFSTSTTK